MNEPERCDNGKYRIGTGPCVYPSLAHAKQISEYMTALGLFPGPKFLKKLDRDVRDKEVQRVKNRLSVNSVRVKR